MRTFRLVAVASLVLFGLALAGANDGSCVPVPQESFCVQDGVQYEVGESFPSSDGCNSCTCMVGGQIACTLMACGCMYDGDFHLVGDSFPATDGCNTCTCLAGGGIACTEMYCPPDDCDPAEEWWRDYIGTPETCPVIRFVCLGDAVYFANDCGCGCEQADDCPQWFNCMPGPGAPPCNVEWIEEHCPYSGIAW